VQVICGDVEETLFDKKFDCIMVYNAFPHFPNPERLIKVLASWLKPGGTLTVAHGMSRAQIDHRHEGGASKVSVDLMHEDALAELFEKYLTVTVKISDDRMYQITGRK
jgi:demethylmenaquinone methyltransferase/2-methoxy-6-polyprenyl-1,4-benzoquinol methylase